MNAPPQPVAEPGIQRVSTVELYFDLVFVFAITQLTSLVEHPHGPGDYAKALLVFMTLMWIYAGYAWLTSNLAIERPWQRQLLFVAMAGFFVMALSVPDVFEAGGLPYALGLLGVTAIHAYLFTTAPTTGARAIWGIAGFNFTAALLVFAAAFVRPPWDWPLWTAAVAVLLIATVKRREENFEISPAHFVERNGLLLIVALGESVVAVGVGASGLPLDAALVVAAVLALFLSASIWWTYFDRDDRRAEHQMTAASPAERARMALLGFGYAHFVMILGIVLIAAGLEVGIAHSSGPAEPVGVWNLAAGLAIYLVGDTLYRRVLRIGPGRLRLLIAALACATVPLGLTLGVLAQIAACVLLLQPLWLVDEKQDRRNRLGASGEAGG
jgi:low temperature requirement protein LtrA